MLGTQCISGGGIKELPPLSQKRHFYQTICKLDVLWEEHAFDHAFSVVNVSIHSMTGQQNSLHCSHFSPAEMHVSKLGATKLAIVPLTRWI